ncbi:MAG: tripartite tricarboxylate transporter substrate binding protein, partial [Bradyrhizobium sp.]|nr:tripartite tricarboxylate transporter substrate binding protein [Bradyrhizobium sp.]
MRPVTRRFLLTTSLVLPALRPAGAQDAYPSRPITLVIPWAAGGSTDVLGRLLVQSMAADLGQPIVV